MYPMLQNRFRAQVTRLITPICRGLLRVGLTANSLTVIGALGTAVSALFFYPRGDFFLGTLVVTFFVLSDLFDGTMARLTNSQGTRWGALLDSTLDRVSDAAIFTGIWIYLYNQGSNAHFIALLALFLGGLIPYIRARAESLGIECTVGLAERAERLIIILVGAGVYGLGLDIALIVALNSLALLSLVTVVQRLLVVYRA